MHTPLEEPPWDLCPMCQRQEGLQSEPRRQIIYRMAMDLDLRNRRQRHHQFTMGNNLQKNLMSQCCKIIILFCSMYRFLVMPKAIALIASQNVNHESNPIETSDFESNLTPI